MSDVSCATSESPDHDETKAELAKRVLKTRFGFGSFRQGQAELVSAILNGRDCVGVMPTGAGKSICYQVPALALAFPSEGEAGPGTDEGGRPGGALSRTSPGERKGARGTGGHDVQGDALMPSFSGERKGAREADGHDEQGAALTLSFPGEGESTPRSDERDARGTAPVLGEFRPASALAIVISPLVSLMSDQVMALKNAGIPAAYLNSRLSAAQQAEVIARARAGAYALMYVAPERLGDARFRALVGATLPDGADHAGAASAQDADASWDYWEAEAAYWDEAAASDTAAASEAAMGWPSIEAAGAPGSFSADGVSQAHESAGASRAAAPYASAAEPAVAQPFANARENASAGGIPISLIAVDEAHCVSQWGQDFRPSYLGIAEFIRSLPTRPTVAAFTATATPRVADDIVRLLELHEPLRITTGFDRPNLRFEVEQLTDKKKLARIAARALADPGESGIVYCSTRKDVERVHGALVEAGVRATRYHAGLSHGEREANQRAFVNDDAPVMVATNAFGMGIDKSNVRYVIHHNMPGSLEAYYQEAGRAGRDGEPSDCLLLWNDGDIATCRFFIEQESGNEALTPDEQQRVRASQRRRLAAMSNYCMTCDCLRTTILRYFGERGGGVAKGGAAQNVARPGGTVGDGERSAPGSGDAQSDNLSAKAPAAGTGLHHARDFDQGRPEDRGHNPDANADGTQARNACGNCSNCDGQIDAIDVTKTARSVMRCVHELRGRFGKGIVADVLCGSNSARIREYGLTRKKTYDIVSDSSATVKEIIELLTAGEYLEISEGRYPLVGLGPRAREAATDEFRLYMKRRRKCSGAQSATTFRRSGARTFAASLVGSANAASQIGSASVGSNAGLSAEEQLALFERLRQLRKRLAEEEGVPPYIVFSDAALRAMCEDLPATEDDFLAVSGVGPAKLKRYGKAFLAEINS